MAVRARAYSGSVVEVEGGIHECNMREGLGEVPHETFALRIVLLREQAKVIAQRKQALEQRSCVLNATDRLQAAHHPEAARKKDTLSRWEPVIYLRGVVPHDQSTAHKLSFDRFDCTDNARISAWQKADQRHQKQSGIELIRSVGLDETALLRAECALADFRVNRVAQHLPFLNRSFILELFRKQHRAVEGYPGHHLRIGEMLRPPAYLPYALIGQLPDFFHT